MTERKGFYLYGLDISLKNTGVAIYDLEKKEFVHIDSFNTESIKATYEYKGMDVNAVKIHKLKEWFENLTKEYPPYFVSIEQMVLVKRKLHDGSFGYNVNEIKGIAKATGIIQSVVWNIPQAFHYPSEVKSAIISGNASKIAVQNEILRRLPKLSFNNDDESDACAVAICHLIEVGIMEWEKEVVVKKKTTKKKSVDKKIK